MNAKSLHQARKLFLSYIRRLHHRIKVILVVDIAICLMFFIRRKDREVDWWLVRFSSFTEQGRKMIEVELSVEITEFQYTITPFLVFCDDDEDFEVQNWFVSSTLFSLFLQASGKDESDNPDTNGGHLTCFVLQASNHAVPLCWLVSYSYFSAPISRASKILAQGRLPLH